MLDSELLHLLKYGRADEVRFQMGTSKKNDYSNSFPAFIDEMLKEHKVKRKNVAIRSGLSQDYTYKLLRGDKKTIERDYILAICIAIGMNLPQTQHALHIYGMPILDKRDLRSQVIMIGIQDGRNIDDINTFLEKAGFPYLKTSPDMPSAEIRPITDIEVQKLPKQHEYTEVNREITAQPCGPAPVDYLYSGLMHIQDEDENNYTISAVYSPAGAFLYALKGTVPSDNVGDVQESDILESFESLTEAAGSPFFEYYLELDKATDDKVAETLTMVDDTKNYGTRVGFHITGGKDEAYIEVFNHTEPERCEYFQVIRSGDEYTYSMTHESLFMRMEMGSIYPAYFGEHNDEPKYLIKVCDPREAGKIDPKYKFLFTSLRHQLNLSLGGQFGDLFEGDETPEEMSEFYAQQAVIAMHSGDMDKALQMNQKVFEINKDREDLRSKVVSLITASKIGNLYQEKGDLKEQNRWLRVVLSYADTVRTWFAQEETHHDAVHVADVLANAYRRLSVVDYQSNKMEDAKRGLEESIFWYEKSDIDKDIAYSFADALAGYAVSIDEEEPERSLEYTGKAIRLIRQYQLDQGHDGVNLAQVILNNHAWVLWNRLGSEEAIIYYGQAVDLLESYLSSNDDEEMAVHFRDIAKSLYQIYDAAGKEKERERLKARMLKYGVDVSEDK